VPIKLFLSPYELTPTHHNINNKFSLFFILIQIQTSSGAVAAVACGGRRGEARPTPTADYRLRGEAATQRLRACSSSSVSLCVLSTLQSPLSSSPLFSVNFVVIDKWLGLRSCSGFPDRSNEDNKVVDREVKRLKMNKVEEAAARVDMATKMPFAQFKSDHITKGKKNIKHQFRQGREPNRSPKEEKSWYNPGGARYSDSGEIVGQDARNGPAPIKP
ncbi:Vacuolar protein sorting-associated protein 26, partial [Cynara cardunculus var. scolymus]